MIWVTRGIITEALVTRKPGRTWSDRMGKQIKHQGEQQWAIWVESCRRISTAEARTAEPGWQGGGSWHWGFTGDRSVHVRPRQG